jgi:membrane protease subunit HflK
MSSTLKPTIAVAAAERPAAQAAQTARLTLPPGWGSRRVIAGAVVLLWLLSGVYIVGPDQQAVVTRFGKVENPRVLPGIGWTWPYPIGEVHKLKVLQRQRAFIGGAPADQPLGQVEPLASQFLTGDQNLINIRTVVQYSVATPDEYLFRAEDVGRAVSAAAESELARQIASRNVDDVLTTEKVAIQETVRQRAQELVDGYGLGVVVSTVSIEYIAPPPETAAAFRDVASARADSVRIVSEAEGYSNDLIPRARGEATQLSEEAQAYQQRKADEAHGDAARFTQLEREYAKNPALTSSRLYLETMEEVLPRLKKTIVDSQGSLDMTIIRRNAPPRSEDSSLPPPTTAFPPLP